MNIEITETDNSTSINISGAVESADIKEFSELINSLCESSDKAVEINLANADYLDSTGISLLIKLHKAQKQRNLDFSIVEASEKVTSLLTLCSLYDTLTE
ncbi:MAG: STAS domain-containing protein [Spirochaetota bacterium]